MFRHDDPRYRVFGEDQPEEVDEGQTNWAELGADRFDWPGGRTARAGSAARQTRAARRSRRARVGAVAFLAMAVGALVAHEIRSTVEGVPGASTAGPATAAPRSSAAAAREQPVAAAGRLGPSRSGTAARHPAGGVAHPASRRSAASLTPLHRSAAPHTARPRSADRVVSVLGYMNPTTSSAPPSPAGVSPATAVAPVAAEEARDAGDAPVLSELGFER
ncbi:MAG TPA: hypothetical protein VMU32_07565 [Solirubrobacteraceae bacterium]|nr:hypothetical protein [Solirubrobacteraceae bacterium]